MFSSNLEFIDIKKVPILFWYGNYSKRIYKYATHGRAFGDLSGFVKESNKISIKPSFST